MDFEDAKQTIHNLRMFWRITAILVLSTVFVPLFLANAGNGMFGFTTVSASLIGYLILVLAVRGIGIALVRDYLERTGYLLLAAFLTLGVGQAAFLTSDGPSAAALARLVIMAAGFLYAIVLQRISFLWKGF